MSFREERAARNEALFREVNEQVKRLSDAWDDPTEGRVGFVCECSDDTCTETVHVSLEKYEAVRANARQFLLVPGHEGAFERVVERGDGYVVVEKEGEAGRLAEQTDPHAG